MSVAARKELSASAGARYRSSSRKEKGRILDQFVKDTGYDRKYAIRVLTRGPRPAPKGKRKRQRIYDEPEVMALKRLWPTSGYLSGKRLVGALPGLIDALERHAEWVPEQRIRDKLLGMSASTCERLLRRMRPVVKLRGRTVTRPAKVLRREIEVRTGVDWSDKRPGFCEGDLVGHCGESSSGDFLYSLDVTDVLSGWTEFGALRGKGQIETLVQLKAIRGRLPFKLLGLDFDNGGEFLNYHVHKFCIEEDILMTRCRPYVKNDQCHVEQKNGAIIRKHVGYGRLEGDEALARLKELFGVLRLLVNFFEPSVKLISKERVGKKTVKKYDKSKTPYQRLMESEHLTSEEKERLHATYLGLNPAALRRRLQLLKRGFLEDALVTLLDEATE